MSTKTVDQTSFSFDPTQMATMQALQPAYRQNMMDFMNNPMQSMFFNTQMQMQNAQNRAYFGNSQNMLNQNAAAGGFYGNASAFQQMNNLNNSRALSAANANTFNNLLLGANQLRFGATQGAGSFRPMQTGSTNTKTQSGLGTWLPQLAGMAMGAATMGAGGGMFSPFMSMGQTGGSTAAKGYSGAPMSFDQTMMPSGNTLIGPTT